MDRSRTALDVAEERAKASINLRDGDTIVAMSRITKLFNAIHEAGFAELGMKPQWGTGFSGDAALLLERFSDAKPMFATTDQKRMQALIADADSERFSSFDYHDSQSRPVYLVIEDNDINKKVIGFEWDRVAIYQPHEPELLNYIKEIADEVRKYDLRLMRSDVV
jgi:hypothetical protein